MKKKNYNEPLSARSYNAQPTRTLQNSKIRIATAKNKNYFSKIIFLMMIFYLNSIPFVKGQWVAPSTSYSDDPISAFSSGVKVTNSDFRDDNATTFPNGVKALVCDGSNPGLYWRVGTGSPSEGFIPFQHTSDVVSPDVTIIQDKAICEGQSPFILAVYYVSTSGSEDIHFESFLWVTSLHQFVLYNTYSLTGLFGSVNHRIENCIHIKAGTFGDFVIIWDQKDADVCSGCNGYKNVKFVTGYFDCITTRDFVFRTPRIAAGDALQWPDVAIFENSNNPSGWNHNAPDEEVDIIHTNDNVKKLWYRTDHFSHIISNNFANGTSNKWQIDQYSTSYQSILYARIACPAYGTGANNWAAVCYLRDNHNSNPNFTNNHQICLRFCLSPTYPSVPDWSAGLDPYFVNDFTTTYSPSQNLRPNFKSYDPCVTYSNDNNSVVCGFTSENTSVLNGVTCAVHAFSVNPSSTSTFAGSDLSNGWIVPNNYVSANYSQNAISLSGSRFYTTDSRILYGFNDPTSTADVYTKDEVLGTTIANGQLRIASSQSSGNDDNIIPYSDNNTIHFYFKQEFKGVYNYELFDLRGRKVLVGTFNFDSPIIDISTLHKSIYILKFCSFSDRKNKIFKIALF